MKRMQKRMGNKGFSLVELIVVIAIMAVLVGVLAPTLIKNVEKSRESKDMQNLDTTKGAFSTLLAEEKWSTDTTTGLYGKTVTITSAGAVNIGDTANADLKTALTEITGSVPTMTSKIATGKSITVIISNTGGVDVKVDLGSGNTSSFGNSYEVK